jgi:hypothetical protein
MKTKTVLNSTLKIGDIIEVWWRPGRDTIINLEKYTGNYKNEILFKNARFASFASRSLQMTLFANDVSELIVLK